MVLDITAAQGATTGGRYEESLKDGRETRGRTEELVSRPVAHG